MKYKYYGGLSAEIIDGKEIVFANGNTYEFNPDVKRVQTLIKLGFLKKFEEKNTKKGQK